MCRTVFSGPGGIWIVGLPMTNQLFHSGWDLIHFITLSDRKRLAQLIMIKSAVGL